MKCVVLKGGGKEQSAHFLCAFIALLCARLLSACRSVVVIMGALKRLKTKLTRGGKEGKTFGGAPKARVALGDATNVNVVKARDFPQNAKGEKTHNNVVRTPGKKKTATKPFRTADVTTNAALNAADDAGTTTTRGAARFTAVDIFEDEDRGEDIATTPSIDSPELKAPPPSSASSSFSSPKKSSSSSKSALDAWADALVGRGDEEVKEEKVARGTKPTKNDFEVEDNVFDVALMSPRVSYELSDSECGSPMRVAEERVLGNVDESVNDETEDGVEDALESYLFTPPAVPTKTNIERVDKETFDEEPKTPLEEKKNTQSARLSSSMWDINSTTKKVDIMSFMKNASAMDVAMGAGVAAVVFNFFMPSFLKASF